MTSPTPTIIENEDEEDIEQQNKMTSSQMMSLHGSLAPAIIEPSNFELFYSQFQLNTKENKIAQIALIKVTSSDHVIDLV